MLLGFGGGIPEVGSALLEADGVADNLEQNGDEDVKVATGQPDHQAEDAVSGQEQEVLAGKAFPGKDGEAVEDSVSPDARQGPDLLTLALAPFFKQESFGVTKSIIAINIVLFVAMVVMSAGQGFWEPSNAVLETWGGNLGAATFDGEYGRLLSCVFLHIGIVHLLVNMAALAALGRSSERLFGSGRFLTLYILSGIAGSVGSLLFHPAVISAGASGAIFGVYGSSLAFFFAHKDQLDKGLLLKGGKAATAFIIFNLVLGVVFNFDIAAHIVGLLAGVACGFIALPSRSTRAVIVGFVSMTAAIVGCFALSTSAPLDFSGDYRYQKALRLLPRHQFAQAKAILDELCNRYPEDGAKRLMRAYLLHSEGADREALADVERALNTVPDAHKASAHTLQAELLFQSGRYDEAGVAATNAVDSGADSTEIYGLRCKIALLNGNATEALRNLELMEKLELVKKTGRPMPPYFYLLRATAYGMQDDFESGINDLNQLMAYHGASKDALIARADLFSDAGKFDLALQDVDAAANLSTAKNEDVTVMLERGQVYRRQGDARKALAELSRAKNAALLSKDKSVLANVYYSLAAANFCLGRNAEAGSYGRKFIELSHEPDRLLYCVVWIMLADKERGEAAGGEKLNEALLKENPGKWPVPVLAYFDGSLTLDQLLRAAKNNGQLTEAKVYAALDLKVAGKSAEANELLNWVLEHGNKRFVEYERARYELSRGK
ncbi:MAG: rhomboid family intramembrane serine protease [Candidatus Obscuribacterales bacterium]|nr:rhomboid family intramembrane serine protease [Candidatus Obscuribacterales bacterium]